jgi:hypothetical protein
MNVRLSDSGSNYSPAASAPGLLRRGVASLDLFKRSFVEKDFMISGDCFRLQPLINKVKNYEMLYWDRLLADHFYCCRL